jgi:hypothetical protein
MEDSFLDADADPPIHPHFIVEFSEECQKKKSPNSDGMVRV